MKRFMFVLVFAGIIAGLGATGAADTVHKLTDRTAHIDNVIESTTK